MSRFMADLAWAKQTRETPPTQEWFSASPPPRYWWGANVDRLYWHFPLTQVNGSQHGAAPLQVPFCGTHETFAWAVGATSDDITGTATAEVIPTRLSNCRRVRAAAEAGGVTLSCNRWSLPSCSRAYQTTWSSTGEVASVVTSRAISRPRLRLGSSSAPCRIRDHTPASHHRVHELPVSSGGPEALFVLVGYSSLPPLNASVHVRVNGTPRPTPPSRPRTRWSPTGHSSTADLRDI